MSECRVNAQLVQRHFGHVVSGDRIGKRWWRLKRYGGRSFRWGRPFGAWDGREGGQQSARERGATL